MEWSSDFGQYMARCLEIDGLDATAPTAREALERAEDPGRTLPRVLVGMRPPQPLSERNFSGRFVVRTSRSLHARLVMEATEQRVSLNQWIVQKLEDRKPSLDW